MQIPIFALAKAKVNITIDINKTYLNRSGFPTDGNVKTRKQCVVLVYILFEAEFYISTMPAWCN